MHHQKHGVARAFFAVALGPTIGTAKSRVIVGIDGLETKVWGFRDDNIPNKTRDVSTEENGDPLESASDEESEGEGDESEDSSEEEDDDDASGSDGEPPSRSPSPALSSDSDSSSTSPLDAPEKSPPPRAEDPETVRAAERLLSRTLASACAEDDGQGLAAEMGTPKPYQRYHRLCLTAC